MFNYFRKATFSNVVICMVLTIAVLLTACQKSGELGPPGPAGPAGSAGPAGPAGSNGSNGNNGNNGATGPAGSANVIYSPWFTPDAWTMVTLFSQKHFQYMKATPQITQGILDSGQVIVFGKLNGYNPVLWPTGTVAALPISLTYQQGSAVNTDTWSALCTAGNINLDFVNNVNYYSSISNQHQFRYVIIPGAVSTGRRNYARMSYAQLCTELRIPQ